MMTSDGQAPGHREASPPDSPPSAYEPPQAEDIDTTLGPAETSAGAIPHSNPGVEESSRWH